MPVLDNERHEAFAQQVAIGTPYTAAYLQAGFETNSRDVASVNACRLMRDEKIVARIEEIKTELGDSLTKNYGVSREWLIRLLERNIAIAYGLEPIITTVEPVRNADGSLKLDEKGEEVLMPVRKYRYEPAAANKSLELLGQLMGEFRRDMTLRGDPNAPLVPPSLNVAFVGPLAEVLTKVADNAQR